LAENAGEGRADVAGCAPAKFTPVTVKAPVCATGTVPEIAVVAALLLSVTVAVTGIVDLF